MCTALCVFVLRVFVGLFHQRQGALPLLQALAMPFGSGLRHLGLLPLARLGLLVDPFVGDDQRLLQGLLGAWLMPVRADNLLAAIVGIERAMGDHPLATGFLSLAAFAVYAGPCAHRSSVRDRWGPPVYQGFPRSGLDDDKMPGIVWPGGFPLSALDWRAILQGVHQ